VNLTQTRAEGGSVVDIIFKGRRTDVPERFRGYASAKLGRIAKLDQRAIRVDVEVSAERNPRQSDRRERVELTIRSRGPAIRAEAAADDRYTALDRALAKLEERLRRAGDRRKAARHGAPQASRVPGPRGGLEPGAAWTGGAPAGVLGNGVEPARDDGAGPDRAGPEIDGAGRPQDGAEPGGVVPIQMEGDCPVVVREKFHAASAVTVDQALLEMELVGHDFYLFRDEQCGGLPSVVYRRRGYQYGLIRLVEQEQAGPDMAATGGGLGRSGGAL
jgi:ribosomal subunit interface protein